MLTKTLAFAVVVEVATGLALIFKPALVIKLLLGVEASGMEMVIGRCFGIGLFGLSFACWPDTPEIGEHDGGVSRDVDLQRADRGVSRLSRHGRAPWGTCCCGPPSYCTPW